MWRVCWIAAAVTILACAPEEQGGRTVTISASAVGREGALLRLQIKRFMREHPDIRVLERRTPDAADQRHQLYVQWLNAGVPDPDVLQLDVIWTTEFAAAGWILPVGRDGPAMDEFLPGAVEANRWRDRVWAVPWFVDVGMLYYRTDLVDHAPATFEDLEAEALRAQREGGAEYGLLWQGARYEGLVTTFLEHAGGFGGAILDRDLRVVVDDPPAIRALEFMRRSVRVTHIVPEAVLSWQEEETRLAFQNGHAAFLRSWPYAWPLFNDPDKSRVAGKVAVAPMPASGGRPTAALGGAQLAVNAHTQDPEAAWALVEYLARPEQMLERVRVVGQYPTRPALFEGDALHEAIGIPPAEVKRIVEAAVPRPPTPIYTELSQLLQVRLHRALTGQEDPAEALHGAAREMRAVLAAAGLGPDAGKGRRGTAASPLPLLVALALLVLIVAVWLRRRSRAAAVASVPIDTRDERLAWAMVAPVFVVIALVAVFPLGSALWESLHAHDLRMPWLGRPFVGLANYAEAVSDPRFWEALGHTAIFAAGTVFLELGCGLALALALDASWRGRSIVRATVLLPWAIPTVVAALVWRFVFDGQTGIANAVLAASGLVHDPIAWFTHATLAWVPVILSDVWKTTPFVSLLLLAGLQGIDPSLHEAARVDGARSLARFWHITLPLLRPAILVALLFRTLDAVRVFDLVYVLTGGGPGTATEPIAVYTHGSLLQSLRFGYGSALSVLIFVITAGLAFVYVRFLGADLGGSKS